jgi:hypothetical protein
VANVKNELAYFSKQSPMSDPEAFSSAYEDLPRSIPELVNVLQRLTLHEFWAERY